MTTKTRNKPAKLLRGDYMAHDAATMPVDAYHTYVARYGMEPQRIKCTGGAILVGPLPERKGQGDGT